VSDKLVVAGELQVAVGDLVLPGYVLLQQLVFRRLYRIWLPVSALLRNSDKIS
jgi:hypothetical protein